MALLTYYEAMELLVWVYERYIGVQNQIEQFDPEYSISSLEDLLTKKEELLKEMRILSAEPLSTIEQMVNEHKNV